MTTFGIRLPSCGLGVSYCGPPGNSSLRGASTGDSGGSASWCSAITAMRSARSTGASRSKSGSTSTAWSCSESLLHLVALGHALHDAYDRVEYLTLRERATLCLTEIVPAGHRGECR